METLHKDDWVHVWDANGKDLGYLSVSDCEHLGIEIFEATPADQHLSDPYFLYHGRMAKEKGLLSGDMNAVRDAVLQSQLVKEREEADHLHEMNFREQMLVNNPKMFEIYMERMEQEKAREEADQVEWATPDSVNELAEIMSEIRDIVESEEEGIPRSSEEAGLDEFTDLDDNILGQMRE